MERKKTNCWKLERVKNSTGQFIAGNKKIAMPLSAYLVSTSRKIRNTCLVHTYREVRPCKSQRAAAAKY